MWWFFSLFLNLSISVFVLAGTPDPCDGALVNQSRSEKFWQDYEEAWIPEARLDYVENTAILQQAITENHPQIRFLRQLGFQITIGWWVAPSLSQIHRRLNELIDELVSSGQLAPEDTIRPSRIIATTRGPEDFRALNWGEYIPKGWAPYAGIPRGGKMIDMIANGHFPLAELALSRTFENHASIILHDLGHFGAMIRDPGVMRGIRKAYQFLAKSDAIGGPMHMHMGFVVESLEVVDRRARTEFLQALARFSIPPFHSTGENFPNREKYEAILEEKTDRQILQAATYFLENTRGWIQGVGGIMNDLTSIGRFRNRVGRDLIRDEGATVTRALRKLAEAESTIEKRKALAVLIAIIDLSSQIIPEDWIINGLLGSHMAKDSILYHYLCRAKVFEMGSMVHSVYCE